MDELGVARHSLQITFDTFHIGVTWRRECDSVLLADDVHSSLDFLSFLVEGVNHHHRCLDRVLLKPLRIKHPRSITVTRKQHQVKSHLIVSGRVEKDAIHTMKIASLMCTSRSLFVRVAPVSGQVKNTPVTERHAGSFTGTLTSWTQRDSAKST